MKNISQLDKNFQVVEAVEDGMAFYDVDGEPFKVYGLLRHEDYYCRMPAAVAAATSEGVAELNGNTAGGRVRFVTDSTEIAIRAEMHQICRVSHCTLTGTAGFDMYVDGGNGDYYAHTFVPPYGMTDGYSGSRNMGTSRPRVITINFPLYSGVKRLLVGVKEGAMLAPAPAYRVEKPVVYYGSSITQGGCASRPGTCYEAIISRLLGCNYINLGFSGNARGEAAVAEHIAGLDMSAFVLDYDHNAPSVEHLAESHPRMFRTVREKHPDLPILMMSAPMASLSGNWPARLAVIRRTFEEAKAAGDKNVYLLAGAEMISARNAETWSVDGIHPNDNGFTDMAHAVADVMKNIL